MTEEKFIITIKVTREKSGYTASGDLTAGMIKLMLGEMEVIKSRLIQDFEKTVDDGY